MRRKREKKYEMGEGEGGCMCVVGEMKKERQRGYMGGGEKKKNGEWGVGSGVYEYGGKKGRVEKKEEKKLKRKKLNWFYLYVHFIWCKV
jgi:hypothetical protein